MDPVSARAIMFGAQQVTTAGGNVARQAILHSAKDQYNEDEVKARVLFDLEQIKEDTKVLRNVDFRTAKDTLSSWQASSMPYDCQVQKERIRRISECGARAFNTVPTVMDKLTAARFVVFADYHSVALSVDPPDWKAGKHEAQRLLEQYTSMLSPQLEKATEEELGLKMRMLFRDKSKRRELLNGYAMLHSLVYDYCPASANTNHPKCPLRFAQAALHAMERSEDDFKATMDRFVEVLVTSHTPLPELYSLHDKRGYTYCCYPYSADGAKVVSGNYDGTLVVRETYKGRVLCTLEGHTQSVKCCTVYNYGGRCLSGSDDTTLKVWDLTTGNEMFSLCGHTGGVTCCQTFANGSRALSGSTDKSLKIWDLRSGNVLVTLKGHSQAVNCCDVYANGTRAVSGGVDQRVRLWDLESRRLLATFRGHTHAVNCCSVFAEGTRVLSGSSDKTLKVWDMSTGQELLQLQGHTHNVNCCTVYGNEGHKALSGSADRTLRVWDLTTGEVVSSLEGHVGAIWGCSVYSNGTRGMSASSDGSLKVWILPQAAEK